MDIWTGRRRLDWTQQTGTTAHRSNNADDDATSAFLPPPAREEGGKRRVAAIFNKNRSEHTKRGEKATLRLSHLMSFSFSGGVISEDFCTQLQDQLLKKCDRASPNNDHLKIQKKI